MRKKILLAGGTAPFEGPRVSLEEGEWLVEPPSLGHVTLVEETGEVHELNGRAIAIIGPSCVWAIITEGEEVHLDARLVGGLNGRP